jgi:DNA-3-methyladenine glycosylase
MRPFPTQAYGLPAADLAPRLIGCTLVRTLPTGERLAGVVVETEAYTGPEDLASHAAGGRRTARNESMWAAPGTVYVYFTYGMHFCMNISCEREGHPAAVLLRALRPTEGIETMRQRRTGTRSRKKALRDQDLASGPGKLCQALAVDRFLDGVNILHSPHLALFDRDLGETEPPVVATARIGLGQAGVWKDEPLRFVWAGSPYRSR